MRKRHNGFVSFMRKRDGKTFVDPNKTIKEGDTVYVRSKEISSSLLGQPVDLVGQTRTVFRIGEHDGFNTFRLSSSDFNSWYVEEDLERLP